MAPLPGINHCSANLYTLANLWFQFLPSSQFSPVYAPLPLGTKSGTLSWAKEKEINPL